MSDVDRRAGASAGGGASWALVRDGGGERNPPLTAAAVDPAAAVAVQRLFLRHDSGFTSTVWSESSLAARSERDLAVGIAEGWAWDNAQATLLTRGLAEMTRLGVVLGGEHQTSRLSGWAIWF